MSTFQIPEQMLAAQVVEFHQPYKIHNIPIPTTLAPNDLLIRVAVASLCHTDFMVRKNIMNTPLPCTASHEGAGTVVVTGSTVDPAAFRPGDRVMAGLLYHPCGTCADCLGPPDYVQYCKKAAICGVNGAGGFFAEYARIDARFAAKLSDRVSFMTAAPLACAGCTVYRGVIRAGVKKGEWIAIVGSGGGLGHLGVRFAKALGVNVVGIDARDEGLELTRKSGADVIVDARIGHGEVVRKVKEVTGGEGVTAAVNVSEATRAVATACAVTKMHGTVVQIAQPKDVIVPFEELVFRDIRVKGSLICSPGEAGDMLALVAEHGISVETNQFEGLGELEKLLELAESGKMKGKGIIVMDEEQLQKEKESGLGVV